MDRLIYTAASGAKHVLEQQATAAHNLANVNTTGFRAQLDAFRAVPVQGDGLPTRTMVVSNTVGSDFSSGAIQMTGRELDVAVKGKGWIAVSMPDGSEAYTRHGSLQVDATGVLQTHQGFPVAGDGGAITVPPEVNVSITADGTVSSITATTKPGTATPLGRLKLVNPPEAELVRGDDGLYRLRSGQPADADPAVVVVGGALENSNVNTVDSMVAMIALARSFDVQMTLMKNAENNAAKATQLLALG
jgi:flagellar basal-body rod protein FlgF